MGHAPASPAPASKQPETPPTVGYTETPASASLAATAAEQPATKQPVCKAEPAEDKKNAKQQQKGVPKFVASAKVKKKPAEPKAPHVETAAKFLEKLQAKKAKSNQQASVEEKTKDSKQDKQAASTDAKSKKTKNDTNQEDKTAGQPSKKKTKTEQGANIAPAEQSKQSSKKKHKPEEPAQSANIAAAEPSAKKQKASTIVPYEASAITTAASSSSAGPGPSASAPSSSSASASAAPSGPDAGPDEGGGQDLTSNFLEVENPAGDPDDGPSFKDQFLEADLVVPGVMLKKMKQAMEERGEGTSFFAVVGEGECKSYRVQKPSVQKMVMADMKKHESQFWTKAANHLQALKVAALMVPSNSELTLEQVTCLCSEMALRLTNIA